jgi:hypothetical protein
MRRKAVVRKEAQDRLGFAFAILGVIIEILGVWWLRLPETPTPAEAVATVPFTQEFDLQREQSVPQETAQDGSLREKEDSLKPEWDRVQRIMNRASRTMKSIQDSRGVIRKQERWGDFLEPVAEIEFQQTVSPFRMYLKWREPHPGREVLYNSEEDSEKLIVLESTPLGRLAPTFSIALDHRLARQVSRHPMPEFNLEWMRGEMRRYINRGARDSAAKLRLDSDARLGDVPCTHVQIVHETPKSVGPKKYQRIDLYFRNEDSMPLRWEKYGEILPGDETPTLVEYIELVDVLTNLGLDHAAFDLDHPDFGFGALIVPLQ